MAQPPAYIIETDFSQDEANNLPGRGEIKTAGLDTELTNIKAFIDPMRTNIALIQRDDGALQDLIVTLVSLSEEVRALLLTDPSTPRGEWMTATAYVVKDLVTETGITYMCVESHTSGVFATDLAAGKWIAITSSGLGAAAVKVAYESNANTNEFDDAEQTKLGTVESGATADQTGAEIKVAYEGEADTNEFSDALLSKLNGIATGAEVNPDVVSQGEAEAGTSTTERIWTSLRVSQAIVAQGGALPSGVVQAFIGTAAPITWILCNGGTIGNGSSGGTTRANADTAALFDVLWNNMADAQAPVSGGRGGSSGADFAADKTITIPDLRGAMVGGTGGTAMATHGDNGGAETVTLGISEIPAHSHNVRGNSSGVGVFPLLSGLNASGTDGATTDTGGGGAHANMPPWVALTYIIKL